MVYASTTALGQCGAVHVDRLEPPGGRALTPYIDNRLEMAENGGDQGDTGTSNDTVNLTLRLTTHPVHPVPCNHAMTVNRTNSVLDIKTRIAHDWDGEPKVEGIVCVQGGRVCRDTEIVGDLFDKQVSCQGGKRQLEL